LVQLKLVNTKATVFLLIFSLASAELYGACNDYQYLDFGLSGFVSFSIFSSNGTFTAQVNRN
jgi:hypothetical protein